LLARYQPKTTYHREMAYLRFPGTSGAKLELYTLAQPPAAEPSYDYKLPGVAEDSPVKRRTRAAIKAPDGVIVGLYSWG
jgi:hypothetical protein